MEVKFKEVRPNLIARLTGELDHHSAANLRQAIDRRLRDQKIENLVLNLEQVSFMDSSGIGVILGRYRQIADRGGENGPVSDPGRDPEGSRNIRGA